jgi:hypothetical protein
VSPRAYPPRDTQRIVDSPTFIGAHQSKILFLPCAGMIDDPVGICFFAPKNYFKNI